MTDPDIHRISQKLVAALGPTLVAALTGSKDRALPRLWAEIDGPEPAVEFARRLRLAQRAWARLEQAEGGDVARACFVGGHELLGEKTLLTGIREDGEREVAAAVTAYLENAGSGG